MSSRKYLEKNIEDMRTLLVEAVAGRRGKFESANQVCERLRRRLTALVGPLPQFLVEGPEGTSFTCPHLADTLPLCHVSLASILPACSSM